LHNRRWSNGRAARLLGVGNQEDSDMTRSLLIAAASLAAFIIPAEAQALDRSLSAVAVHSGGPNGDHHMRGDAPRLGAFGCDGRRDRGRHDGRGHQAFGCAAYGETWGYYDPQINRSWDSDSYNDWWHDRPDRAFPRWVQHNDGCEPDRMWWSGGGWHC
jgi:hypothetical protein